MPDASQPRLFHTYLLGRAAERAQAPAVSSARLTLSYADLARLTEEYATALDEHGLRAGEVMVVELSPRPEAVALMTAAACRAVVFVNLSPELPAARKAQLLRRVGAAAHISATGPEGSPCPVTGSLGDDGRLRLTGRIRTRTEPRPPAEGDLAYIVFTSGSTGTPKGIMMSHRAVVSFWQGFRGFGVAPGVRLGSMAPLQFDFSLLDLGLALGAGGTLVQLSSLLAQQPAGFVRALGRHRVTQMNGVPAIWRALLADAHLAELADTPLDTVLYAGEGFPAEGLRALRTARPGLRLVNGFGHSESIACAYNVLGDELADRHGRVPFGTRAIDGMRMYLVDTEGRVTDEPGRVGEIYVEGDALFDGYWQDTAATAAALVPSPLSGPGVRAFRSRDLGYTDEAGQHYFHSRADTQVKLLGHRIELEEIDLHVRSHPAVTAAATVLDASGDQPRLVVFVVPAPGPDTGTGPLEAELRRHCAGTLPRYMMPARFRILADLPTTVNGKIDRAALLAGERVG
ncbi:AMP-binding protein [Streptomyces sp. NPDC038707]|uniref:AMP-binding protein n=1 Tax=Streptomyces sp. NPDC038707 TaxID=3154329 RepID=UPI0033F03EBC